MIKQKSPSEFGNIPTSKLWGLYILSDSWVNCVLPAACAVCNHNLATKLSTKTRSHLGRKFAPTDLAKKAKHAIAIDLLLFPGGTFPIIKVLAAASQELSTTNIQIENLYNKLTFRGTFGPWSCGSLSKIFGRCPMALLYSTFYKQWNQFISC